MTGTNRGIGLELVKQLAEKTGEEAHIYACCRDPEGASAKVKQLQIFLIVLRSTNTHTRCYKRRSRETDLRTLSEAWNHVHEEDFLILYLSVK